MSGKCPYIATSHSTRRVPPVSLWLFKVRFFRFWFGHSKLKLEHCSSERVLVEKRRHSRLLFKKAELLERQVSLNSHLAYTLRCVYTPGAFPNATWNKKKKKKKKSLLAQTSPALQPLPLAFCQLPIVSGLSINLAQTTAGTNISLSLRVRASYSHSGLAPMRAKRKHRWHCTCFREVSSLTLFQKTGDGRVHRLLDTSMIAKIFSGRTCSMHTTVWLGTRKCDQSAWRTGQVTNASWAHLTVKTMREEWRTSPASIGKARNTTVIAERHFKAEEKRKLKWETHTTQPILACDAPNLVPGP